MKHSLAGRRLPLLVVLALAASAALAQTPAPVEVTNTPTVKVDPSANTVKVDPSANTVKIDPAANTVKIQQAGPLTVGGTVRVAGGVLAVVSGTPTVKTVPQTKTISLVQTGQSFALDTTVTIGPFDCAGYKEIRVAGIPASLTGAYRQAYIAFEAPDGTLQNTYNLGTGEFGVDLIPVLSNRFALRVYVQNSGWNEPWVFPAPMWAYLVN